MSDQELYDRLCSSLNDFERVVFSNREQLPKDALGSFSAGLSACWDGLLALMDTMDPVELLEDE